MTNECEVIGKFRISCYNESIICKQFKQSGEWQDCIQSPDYTNEARTKS